MGRKRGRSCNVWRQPRVLWLLWLLLSQSRFSKEIVACGSRTRSVWRRWDGGHVSVGIHFIDNRHFEPWMCEDFTDGEPFGWVVLQHTTDQISCLCFFFTPGEYFTDAGFVLGTYLGLTNQALRIRLFGSSLS